MQVSGFFSRALTSVTVESWSMLKREKKNCGFVSETRSNSSERICADVKPFSLDFETDNTTSSLHSLRGVIENSHVDVVVEVDLSFLSTINVLSLDTQWETKIVHKGLVVVGVHHWLSDSCWQVIEDPESSSSNYKYNPKIHNR